MNKLDGAIAQRSLSRKFLFTRILDGPKAFLGKSATTFLSLVNPSENPVVVELRLKGSAGTISSSSAKVAGNLLSDPIQLVIGPFVQFDQSIQQLFGDLGDFSAAYLETEVIEGDGLIGFERVEFQDGNSVVGFNPTVPSSPHLYSAQLAADEDIASHVKLLNKADLPLDVVLKAVGGDGELLAPAVSITLKSDEVFEGTAAAIFGFPPDSPAVGSLRVEASGVGIVGDVLFVEPRNLTFAAALPLQSTPLTEAVFHYIASTEEFFTGLAAFNPGSAAAEINVQVFRSTGGSIGETRIALEPGGRFSKTLAQLVPQSVNKVGGYVVLESTRPIVAQQLLGDVNLTVLSALTPTTSQISP